MGNKKEKHFKSIKGKVASEYGAWSSMIQRCTNPNNPPYFNYGGRGITVCERWMSFENFFEDMGEKPSSNHSLDRKDNNLGYYKENCKWSLRAEQNRNKRNNRFIEIDGESKTVTEWSKIYDINYTTICKRIDRGWNSVNAVITKPNKIPNKF